MEQSRRAYLRGAGAIALGVGVAGCSSGNDGGGDGGSSGSSGDGGSSESSGSGSSGPSTASSSGSGDAASAQGTASSETPGPDPAATDLSGTVGDKSVSGIAFVEQSHYEMNGVQGVTGQIKNQGSAPFQAVTIHVTVKPGNKGPYTEELNLGEPLKPGDTERFKFSFGDGAPDDVTGYTIWATGQKS